MLLNILGQGPLRPYADRLLDKNDRYCCGRYFEARGCDVYKIERSRQRITTEILIMFTCTYIVDFVQIITA